MDNRRVCAQNREKWLNNPHISPETKKNQTKHIQTNGEFYAKEIVEKSAIHYVAKANGKLVFCSEIECKDCDWETVTCEESAKKWLNEPYIDPEDVEKTVKKLLEEGK